MAMAYFFARLRIVRILCKTRARTLHSREEVVEEHCGICNFVQITVAPRQESGQSGRNILANPPIHRLE